MLICEQWPLNPGREKWCHKGERSNALFFDSSVATLENIDHRLTVRGVGSLNNEDEEVMEVADELFGGQ